MAKNLIQSFIMNDKLFKVYGTSEEPWFAAKDVGNLLEMKNIRDFVSTLKTEQKDVIHIKDTIGRSQEITLINESALYKIAFKSNKPMATKFQEWVFSDVLPSIRKNGSYNISEDNKGRLEVIKMAKDILEEMGMLDDRSKIIYTDQIHSITMGNENLKEAQSINDTAIAVSDRILERYSLVKNKNNAVLFNKMGRLLAKAYREYYGVEPMKRTQYVDGAPRQVNHYFLKNYQEVLDDVLDGIFLKKNKEQLINNNVIN